ncbi:uncharacterized protein N7458_000036 [Penicillium daleae]|uniref:Uncharacterized protein n=1 Tax=Penicillium daleae TaxID=63821 RepID=A0AAD6G7F2_9EURO|nr:uncharacterized protein N7458_000036 [Penicillium daleae]KAJ5464350.1 hypothetical protein N7458_000036 [Penicillium daleae]
MNVEIAGWDQTCDLPNPENHGETRMDAVKRAWEGAMEMAADSWDRWEITKPKLEAIEKSGANPDYVDQLDVDIDDPGYTQFFALRWDKDFRAGIEKVLHNMNTLINSMPSQNGRPKTELYISCNDGGVAQYKCDNDIAFEVDLPNDAGSFINFCPPFWKQARFDVWKKAAASEKHSNNGGPADVSENDWETVRNLERYGFGTDASSIFHELTHASWIGNTNPLVDGKPTPADNTGFYINSQMSKKCLSNSANCKDLVKNAESFTWYAQYGYFRRRVTPRAEIWPLWGPQQKPIVLPV